LINEKSFLLRDKEGKTCLHVAAEMGAINACRIILDNVGTGLINERDNKKQTPLHLATLHGQARAIKVLIDLGGSCLILIIPYPLYSGEHLMFFLNYFSLILR
jgi:ankyrin repeat protein